MFVARGRFRWCRLLHVWVDGIEGTMHSGNVVNHRLLAEMEEEDTAYIPCASHI